jgi:hexosaminidase
LLASLLGPLAVAAAEQAATAATPAAANGVASAAGLQLRWELQGNLFTEQAPRGRTQARLVIANRGSQPLPARGWTLYFNSMDALRTGAVGGGLVLEQVAGGYFRLKPGDGFAGLAPGQSLEVGFLYPYRIVKLDKAPAA